MAYQLKVPVEFQIEAKDIYQQFLKQINESKAMQQGELTYEIGIQLEKKSLEDFGKYLLQLKEQGKIDLVVQDKDALKKVQVFADAYQKIINQISEVKAGKGLDLSSQLESVTNAYKTALKAKDDFNAKITTKSPIEDISNFVNILNDYYKMGGKLSQETNKDILDFYQQAKKIEGINIGNIFDIQELENFGKKAENIISYLEDKLKNIRRSVSVSSLEEVSKSLNGLIQEVELVPVLSDTFVKDANNLLNKIRLEKEVILKPVLEDEKEFQEKINQIEIKSNNKKTVHSNSTKTPTPPILTSQPKPSTSHTNDVQKVEVVKTDVSVKDSSVQKYIDRHSEHKIPNKDIKPSINDVPKPVKTELTDDQKFRSEFDKRFMDYSDAPQELSQLYGELSEKLRNHQIKYTDAVDQLTAKANELAITFNDQSGIWKKVQVVKSTPSAPIINQNSIQSKENVREQEEEEDTEIRDLIKKKDNIIQEQKRAKELRSVIDKQLNENDILKKKWEQGIYQHYRVWDEDQIPQQAKEHSFHLWDQTKLSNGKSDLTEIKSLIDSVSTAKEFNGLVQRLKQTLEENFIGRYGILSAPDSDWDEKSIPTMDNIPLPDFINGIKRVSDKAKHSFSVWIEKYLNRINDVYTDMFQGYGKSYPNLTQEMEDMPGSFIHKERLLLEERENLYSNGDRDLLDLDMEIAKKRKEKESLSSSKNQKSQNKNSEFSKGIQRSHSLYNIFDAKTKDGTDIPEELNQLYKNVYQKLFNGTITYEEAIKQLTDKVNELKILFDEVSKKWVSVESLGTNGEYVDNIHFFDTTDDLKGYKNGSNLRSIKRYLDTQIATLEKRTQSATPKDKEYLQDKLEELYPQQDEVRLKLAYQNSVLKPVAAQNIPAPSQSDFIPHYVEDTSDLEVQKRQLLSEQAMLEIEIQALDGERKATIERTQSLKESEIFQDFEEKTWFEQSKLSRASGINRISQRIKTTPKSEIQELINSLLNNIVNNFTGKYEVASGYTNNESVNPFESPTLENLQDFIPDLGKLIDFKNNGIKNFNLKEIKSVLTNVIAGLSKIINTAEDKIANDEALYIDDKYDTNDEYVEERKTYYDIKQELSQTDSVLKQIDQEENIAKQRLVEIKDELTLVDKQLSSTTAEVKDRIGIKKDTEKLMVSTGSNPIQTQNQSVSDNDLLSKLQMVVKYIVTTLNTSIPKYLNQYKQKGDILYKYGNPAMHDLNYSETLPIKKIFSDYGIVTDGSSIKTGSQNLSAFINKVLLDAENGLEHAQYIVSQLGTMPLIGRELTSGLEDKMLSAGRKYRKQYPSYDAGLNISSNKYLDEYLGMNRLNRLSSNDLDFSSVIDNIYNYFIQKNRTKDYVQDLIGLISKAKEKDQDAITELTGLYKYVYEDSSNSDYVKILNKLLGKKKIEYIKSLYDQNKDFIPFDQIYDAHVGDIGDSILGEEISPIRLLLEYLPQFKNNKELQDIFINWVRETLYQSSSGITDNFKEISEEEFNKSLVNNLIPQLSSKINPQPDPKLVENPKQIIYYNDVVSDLMDVADQWIDHLQNSLVEYADLYDEKADIWYKYGVPKQWDSPEHGSYFEDIMSGYGVDNEHILSARKLLPKFIQQLLKDSQDLLSPASEIINDFWSQENSLSSIKSRLSDSLGTRLEKRMSTIHHDPNFVPEHSSIDDMQDYVNRFLSENGLMTLSEYDKQRGWNLGEVISKYFHTGENTDLEDFEKYIKDLILQSKDIFGQEAKEELIGMYRYAYASPVSDDEADLFKNVLTESQFKYIQQLYKQDQKSEFETTDNGIPFDRAYEAGTKTINQTIFNDVLERWKYLLDDIPQIKGNTQFQTIFIEFFRNILGNISLDMEDAYDNIDKQYIFDAIKEKFIQQFDGQLSLPINGLSLPKQENTSHNVQQSIPSDYDYSYSNIFEASNQERDNFLQSYKNQILSETELNKDSQSIQNLQSSYSKLEQSFKDGTISLEEFKNQFNQIWDTYQKNIQIIQQLQIANHTLSTDFTNIPYDQFKELSTSVNELNIKLQSGLIPIEEYKSGIRELFQLYSSLDLKSSLSDLTNLYNNIYSIKDQIKLLNIEYAENQVLIASGKGNPQLEQRQQLLQEELSLLQFQKKEQEEKFLIEQKQYKLYAEETDMSSLHASLQDVSSQYSSIQENDENQEYGKSVVVLSPTIDRQKWIQSIRTQLGEVPVDVVAKKVDTSHVKVEGKVGTPYVKTSEKQLYLPSFPEQTEEPPQYVIPMITESIDTPETPVKIVPTVNKEEFVSSVNQQIGSIPVTVKPAVSKNQSSVLVEVTPNNISLDAWKTDIPDFVGTIPIKVKPDQNSVTKESWNTVIQSQLESIEIPIKPNKVVLGNTEKTNLSTTISNLIGSIPIKIDFKQLSQKTLDDEIKKFASLREIIEKVAWQIRDKTSAVIGEGQTVDEVLPQENKQFSGLRDIIKNLSTYIQPLNNTNLGSNIELFAKGLSSVADVLQRIDQYNLKFDFLDKIKETVSGNADALAGLAKVIKASGDQLKRASDKIKNDKKIYEDMTDDDNGDYLNPSLYKLKDADESKSHSNQNQDKSSNIEPKISQEQETIKEQHSVIDDTDKEVEQVTEDLKKESKEIYGVFKQIEYGTKEWQELEKAMKDADHTLGNIKSVRKTSSEVMEDDVPIGYYSKYDIETDDKQKVFVGMTETFGGSRNYELIQKSSSSAENLTITIEEATEALKVFKSQIQNPDDEGLKILDEDFENLILKLKSKQIDSNQFFDEFNEIEKKYSTNANLINSGKKSLLSYISDGKVDTESFNSLSKELFDLADKLRNGEIEANNFNQSLSNIIVKAKQAKEAFSIIQEKNKVIDSARIDWKSFISTPGNVLDRENLVYVNNQFEILVNRLRDGVDTIEELKNKISEFHKKVSELKSGSKNLVSVIGTAYNKNDKYNIQSNQTAQIEANDKKVFDYKNQVKEKLSGFGLSKENVEKYLKQYEDQVVSNYNESKDYSKFEKDVEDFYQRVQEEIKNHLHTLLTDINNRIFESSKFNASDSKLGHLKSEFTKAYNRITDEVFKSIIDQIKSEIESSFQTKSGQYLNDLTNEAYSKNSLLNKYGLSQAEISAMGSKGAEYSSLRNKFINDEITKDSFIDQIKSLFKYGKQNYAQSSQSKDKQSVIDSFNEIISNFVSGNILNFEGVTKVIKEINTLNDKFRSGKIDEQKYREQMSGIISDANKVKERLKEVALAMLDLEETETGKTGFEKFEDDVLGIVEQLRNGEINLKQFNSEYKKFKKAYQKTQSKENTSNKRFKNKKSSKISEIDNLLNTINVQSSKTSDNRYEQVTDDLRKLKEEASNTTDVKGLENIEEKLQDIKNTIASIKQLGTGERIVDFNILGSDRQTPEVGFDSGNLKKATEYVKKYVETLGTVNAVGSFSEPINGVSKLNAQIITTDKQTKNLTFTMNSAGITMTSSVSKTTQGLKGLASVVDTLKNKWGQLVTYWVANMFNPMDIVRYGREILSVVESLDTAMVDLQKTATMTDSELDKAYYNANEYAKSLGVTTEEFISLMADASRAGYSSYEEATQMAQYAAQLTAISPDIDTDESMEGIISTMKAFDITDVDDVLDGILSKINILGNSFSETNGDILTGLEKSSSAMATANNSLDETMALFTAGQEIVQNAETVGKRFADIKSNYFG